MSKVRIYEYAKQTNMSSKEIITILNRLNINVNNHMSVMDDNMIEAVEKFKQDVKSRAATAQERRVEEDAARSSMRASKTTEEKEAATERTAQPKTAVSQLSAEAKMEAAPTVTKSDRKPAAGNQSAHHNRQNQGGNQSRGYQSSASRRQGGTPAAAGNKNINQSQNQNQNQNQNQKSVSVIQKYEDLDTDTTPRDQRIPTGRRKTQAPAGVSTSNKTAGGNFKGNQPPRSQGQRGGNAGRNQQNDFGSRGGNHRGKNQAPVKTNTAPKLPDVPKQIEIEGPMTVGEIAKAIRRETGDVIKKLLFLGNMATINQELDVDAITLVAADYGVDVIVKEPVDQEALDMLIEEEDPAELIERPPVVTIMGHVDHGKTTLLDAIRQTNVTASEAGGITQHIGAYQVEINGKKITFLDTPGHAAFTSMRARGAQVTDITILVVAADDGVMPQTVEAINHAKAANVPIIVAVNKIDKPDANPDRVKQELTEYGLVAEDWGGDTIFVPVSALQKQGLEDLLEMILLVAEVAELKASPVARSRGTVVEAELDKGRGPVATVLVQNGTLRVGDIVVAGTSYGRVRAMVNDRGRRVKEAPPSYPVEIVGLNEVPSAGELFVVYDDERKARTLTERRTTAQRAEALGTNSRVTLEELYKQIQEGEVKDLNVIIKGDVQGSVEALAGSLEKIDVQGARVKIIHRGVGAITESDILLATASNAIVMGFNVRPEVNAAKMAESEKVDIRLYRVIYNAIEEIEAAMKGLLDPEFKEVVIGRAEIRQTFKVSKVGTIAGCYVLEGKLARNAEVRIIREGIVIYEGKFDTLKRFKDDVREVQTGFECGASFERFNDLKEGDIIEAFIMEQIKL